MKKYSYTFIDNGLLSPFFRKKWIEPIISKMPSWASPNLLTLCSLICSSLGLFFTVYFGYTILGVVLTSLCYFLYVTFDNLDGSYARLTNRETPLGEFLDHFHDIYAIGAVQFSFCYFFQITTPFVIIFLFITTFIYTAEKFHLVYHTGCMIFPKFGAWEPLLATLSLFFLNLIIPIPWIEILAVFITGIHFLSSSNHFLRAMKKQKAFAAYFFISFSFLFFLTKYIILFLFLYNLHFIGRVIVKRLIDEAYPKPDLIAPALLLFHHYEIAIAYLGASVCWILYKALLTIPRNENT